MENFARTEDFVGLSEKELNILLAEGKDGVAAQNVAFLALRERAQKLAMLLATGISFAAIRSITTTPGLFFIAIGWTVALCFLLRVIYSHGRNTGLTLPKKFLGLDESEYIPFKIAVYHNAIARMAKSGKRASYFFNAALAIAVASPVLVASFYL